jgi:hypothetical protein
VFTARYALSSCIKQIRFVFKGLMVLVAEFCFCQLVCSECSKLNPRHGSASKNTVRNFMYTVFTENCIVAYVDGYFISSLA